MKNFKLVIFLSLFSSIVCAQSSIQGKITDANAKGVSFANVLLLNQRDSLLVKGAITDESGNFLLSDIANGDYLIESYMIGFAKSYSAGINLVAAQNFQLEPIILKEDISELAEVTVKADKPLYEMEMGKMVVNVASSVTSAGLSAIDVLERSPGIFMNRQNNSFSLGGKDGVIVLMNGKRTRMPMEAAFQMLAGLNASDIEKIEIMTVPPANYDSDGDAGFINIVMKSNTGMVGTNGSITAGMGYGTGPQANMSLNLNHQGRKFNWFGNYSINYYEQVRLWENYRESSNDLETIFSANLSESFVDRTAHNYRFGFDFFISDKTILSGLFSGFNNSFNSVSPTSATFDYSVSTDTTVILTVLEQSRWNHLMGNINLQHTFNKGQVINFNLDYLTYQNSNPSQYDNDYFMEGGTFVRNEENRIFKETPIKLWVAKLDYSSKIGESVVLESGLKGTFSELTNDVVFEEKIGNNWRIDPTYTNYADLTEDILAAFASVKISVDENTDINAGIRYEHTETILQNQANEIIINRNYGNFFPSLFLSRKLNQDNLIQLSYGRRITRPTFNQMAPWVLFTDPYTFFSGNENILPTFTHNIKGDYSYKSVIFSLQYSLDKDVIMMFQPQFNPETNTLVFVSDNIDHRKTWASTVTLPVQFTDWWEIQNNLTANWQKINSEINGEAYQVIQKGLQLNSTNTFKLPKKYTLELAGFYVSPVINGYFNWLSRGFVNLGLQKELNYGGVIRIACNDILETSQYRWQSFDDAAFNLNGRLKFNKRIYMVTYSHKFGNNKIKGTRKRSVGSQEEQNRVTD